MKNLIILLITLKICLLSVDIKAQCNTKLVEIAAAQSGNDALYIKEFKIRYKKVKKQSPIPVARHSTILKKGMLYRFNIANATEFEGEAILQLFDRNILLGSSYNYKTGVDNQEFDFLCGKTMSYQILMSFREAKPGCAVAVLSLVVTDSTLITDSKQNINDEMEILYIGINNPLTIAVSSVPNGTLEINIKDGEISGSKGSYTAKVYKEGITTITVIARDNTGKIKEIGTSEFLVKKQLKPYATISGMRGGIISKEQLLFEKKLELVTLNEADCKKFSIIEFSVSNNREDIGQRKSLHNTFTIEQIKYINQLQSGTTFFINNIIIIDNNNNRIKLNPLGFIIE